MVISSCGHDRLWYDFAMKFSLAVPDRIAVSRLSFFLGGILTFVTLTSLPLSAQQVARPGQISDTSVIAPDGTAYVTRVVPVPKTLSPEAQKSVGRVVSDAAGSPETVAQARAGVDKWQAGAAVVAQQMYPARVAAGTMANVPVRIVTPLVIASDKRDRVLLNLHGGGFKVDSGSLVESIPMASLTGIKVISVLYRMAPEHPYPAALDDAVAVYKELLKTHKPAHIGVYGSSAGAILTAELTARLKQLGLPLPGVTGVFSGLGDFSRQGDSIALYGLNGFAGHLDPPPPVAPDLASYAGKTDLKDPVLSPIYGDLHGFPPTLFVTSGRDLLLSGTSDLDRAYLRAGVEAQLVLFDALPHTFWNDFKLPESKEALHLMADFLARHLNAYSPQL
jgi:monoterpene epsilon-lactone hydrolase